tara:strand:+ start:278 stop:643 length:366 start_codon:yes stop_codon:yes gene_type:complete
MRAKYPDRIPIIIHAKGKHAPSIDKHKFMTPRDLSFSQLFYVVRKRIQMDPSKALFFFLENNTLVVASSVVEHVYTRYADDDGFLYVTYRAESAFGCASGRTNGLEPEAGGSVAELQSETA